MTTKTAATSASVTTSTAMTTPLLALALVDPPPPELVGEVEDGPTVEVELKRRD